MLILSVNLIIIKKIASSGIPNSFKVALFRHKLNDLYGKRIQKRMDTCICITESHFCIAKTNTTL